MTDKEKRLPAVLAENPDTPVLPGWVGLPEAGELLGTTRQNAFKRAKSGGFKSMSRIGKSFSVVVSTEEIESIIAGRKTEETRTDDGESELT